MTKVRPWSWDVREPAGAQDRHGVPGLPALAGDPVVNYRELDGSAMYATALADRGSTQTLRFRQGGQQVPATAL
ncbi:hypothetical protein ACFW1A_14410 [Kitasatospora sp. NPDC058965]|uniref:hypothetical protein n=1 Tax=Kitasatospora sp. NPDC058965 TaxID=3346682 RepID=UPI0036906A92